MKTANEHPGKLEANLKIVIWEKIKFFEEAKGQTVTKPQESSMMKTQKCVSNLAIVMEVFGVCDPSIVLEAEAKLDCVKEQMRSCWMC